MSRILSYNAKQWEIPLLLDGRKTVTRRPVRYKYSNTEMKMRTDKYGTRLIEIEKDIDGETFGKNSDGSTWHKLRGYIEPKAPFNPGNILYVQETWQHIDFAGENNGYVYKVSENGILWETETENWKWRPSIHMPKEAARIWLKVTDVRVERLQDITNKQARMEGVTYVIDYRNQGHDAAYAFASLWDSTIKKTDIDLYGWAADPWVWVIEFERCEKPELLMV